MLEAAGVLQVLREEVAVKEDDMVHEGVILEGVMEYLQEEECMEELTAHGRR